VTGRRRLRVILPRVRRIVRISSLGFLACLLVAALVYVANPFSARTWILGKALRSPVSSVRSAAERKLAAGDPDEAAEAFVDARARGKDDELQSESYSRFGLLPPETAGKLASLLDDPDPSRAEAAADGLEMLAGRYERHDFSAFLPALLRALERRNASLSWSAASAAKKIDPRSPELVKAILQNARNGNPPVLYFLRSMELSDADVSRVLETLVTEDLDLRVTVALTLGWMVAHEGKVVPALVTLLEDREGRVVGASLSSLEELWQRDPAIIRKVIDLLRRDDVRASAIGFLSRSAGSPEAIAAIKAGLRESSRAGEFLKGLRESASDVSPEVIPEILDLCRGTDTDKRLAALDVLGRMGPAARSAVPSIEEILAKESDSDFAETVRLVLEDIRETESPTAPEGR
jgi:hypothetical protein